ncbi:T9SS type A sorting domain-containing protein [Phaeodactylibacter xiamenensis]|nr:T9SS type A sorting domain-containing protein [Phaeodactylibacter xiamenensis]MCR9055301.1 T9SS type A sorting domain-containing protein [bacterium]
MKRLYLLITLTALPMLIGAQEFWAGGYTESLDTIVNGRMLIKAMPDTVVFEPFDSPVQFESTMAGVFDEAGEVLFYTNGCHLYGQNHHILIGGENLNPGPIHDLVCDDYGYIAPKGATIVNFRTHPHLYYVLHLGVQDDISHSISYGPLYLTQVEHDASSGELTVLSANEILLDGEVDPFDMIRHGNGNDWWLITNDFGTSSYHKILLTPDGVQQHEVQEIGYAFPFPPCRGQRSLSASPSGERLVRYGSKCGAQFLTFDRCSGDLEEAGFSPLPYNVVGGGGSVFSDDSEYVYLTYWHQIMKVTFSDPPDTLRHAYRPPLNIGASFIHAYRAPHGTLFIAPHASEPYLHTIPANDDHPDTAMVALEGLPLPYRMQRTIPHYPNTALGDWQDAPCDTLLTSTKETAPGPQHDLLKLYPNPAHQYITLDIALEGEKTVTLVNGVGQVIQEQTVRTDHLRLPLAGFPPGLYFMVLSQNGVSLDVERFIRQ